MLQTIKRFWATPIEDALTPREIQLNKMARIMRWGAIINGLGTLVIIGLSLMAATSNPDLFRSLHDLLMRPYDGAHDAAVVAVGLFMLINTGVLLILIVVTLSQDFWAVGAAWLLVVVNTVLLIFLGFIPALVTIISAGWAGVLMFRDLRAFRVNPVALKEVRGRMRGVRAFIIISVYLGLMSAFTILLYLIQFNVNITSGTAITGELGRILFAGVVGTELVLIIFIAPAFTSGAITGERERKTFDLLQTTLLPATSFIVGKLESALSYILLLLLAAIPLQSIAFLFGGVSETELILAFVILLVTAIVLGSLGIFFSSITDRTITASVRAYTSALVVTFGIPLLLSIFLSAYSNVISGVSAGVGDSPSSEALFIFVGMVAASLNPVTAALFSQRMLIEHQQIAFLDVTLSNGSQIPVIAPWIIFTIIYLIISAFLMMGTVRGVRQVQD